MLKRISFMAVGVAVIAVSVVTGLAKTTPIAKAACSALPTDKGTATLTVNVPSTATYRVWSRLMAPDTTNNSFWLQVDDTTCSVMVGGAATGIAANTWTWVDYRDGTTSNKIDLALTAGSHTITLAGRESGVMVDRLELIANAACEPHGTGDDCAQLPTTVVADLNGDGKVNIFDLSALLSKWGTADANADLNDDGKVNVFDLSNLLSHWTK